MAVERPARIEWPAVFGGAVIATGISMALLAFGAAIGLSVTSTAPTWRESSPMLWLLSGIFLVFVALCSFGFGGYVAGRMRTPLSPVTTDELEFRDGMHGILSWGLTIIFTALLAMAGAAAVTPKVLPTAPVAPSVGENVLATELDELFRSDRRAVDANDLAYRRAEAARILMKTSGGQSLSPDDDTYLQALVAAETGADMTYVAARTNRVVGEASAAIHKARQAAVMQAFLIAAALFLGAAIAWFAAREGGRDRERNVVPTWNWSFRSRTI
jgi:hypothetical protein